MKIKSHTGEMVELRVKMVCRNKPSGETFTVQSICDGFFIDMRGNGWDFEAPITMLSCPFQVGDVFEQLLGEEFLSVPGMVVMSAAQADMMNTEKSHHFRHANPSLRNSPDK